MCINKYNIYIYTYTYTYPCVCVCDYISLCVCGHKNPCHRTSFLASSSRKKWHIENDWNRATVRAMLWRDMFHKHGGRSWRGHAAEPVNPPWDKWDLNSKPGQSGQQTKTTYGPTAYGTCKLYTLITQILTLNLCTSSKNLWAEAPTPHLRALHWMLDHDDHEPNDTTVDPT